MHVLVCSPSKLSSYIESVLMCFHHYLKQGSFAGLQKTKAVFA